MKTVLYLKELDLCNNNIIDSSKQQLSEMLKGSSCALRSVDIILCAKEYIVFVFINNIFPIPTYRLDSKSWVHEKLKWVKSLFNPEDTKELDNETFIDEGAEQLEDRKEENILPLKSTMATRIND